MVRIYRKENTFDSLYTEEAIFDAIPIDGKENLEGEVREKLGSEATVIQIDNLKN